MTAPLVRISAAGRLFSKLYHSRTGTTIVLCDTLKFSPQQIQKFYSHLQDWELERAARFRRESDRTMFVTAHGILRILAWRLFRIPRALLCVERSPSGRPVLKNTSVDFSISHSKGLVAVAVHPFRTIGIDIEKKDATLQYDDLIELLPGAMQQKVENVDAFYRLWTVSEARFKAGVDVEKAPDENENIYTIENDAISLSLVLHSHRVNSPRVKSHHRELHRTPPSADLTQMNILMDKH